MRVASYIVLCSLVLAAWGPRAAAALAHTSMDADEVAPLVVEGPVSVDGADPTPPAPAEEPEPQPEAETEIEQFVLAALDLEPAAPFAHAFSPSWREHLREQSGNPRTHDRPPRR